MAAIVNDAVNPSYPMSYGLYGAMVCWNHDVLEIASQLCIKLSCSPLILQNLYGY